MISITMRPRACFTHVAEVRFPYDPETVAEFKRAAGGRAFWNRFQKFWEVADEPVIARIQAWATERNGPELAEREVAETVRVADERADRDAAEVIIAAAHARHPGRLARVGHSLMLCIVPQDLRLRGDVKAILARHGMPAHRTVMQGGVSLDRTDRETDTSYATRLVAAVEEVLDLLHGDDDAVTGLDLGAPDVPVRAGDEAGTVGSVGHDLASFRTADDVRNLNDPETCRQAVWRFEFAPDDAAQAQILQEYGLTSEDDLLTWQAKHRVQA